MCQKSAKRLNFGIKASASLRRVRLNFCIYNDEILKILLPSLTTNLNLQEINLAANGLSDRHDSMLSKIIQCHCEHKDETVWQYGLRNEKPPYNVLQGLKRFNLSHNELTTKAVFSIARVLVSDTYLRALNLRGNLIDEEGVRELHLSMKSNNSLMNLDLRENPGLSPVWHRKIALQMLNNYTKVGQVIQLSEFPQLWKKE